MDLSLPRGINDVEPDTYQRQAAVKSAFEEVSRAYNFKLMEPASLEHLSTLRAKSGEQIDREIYNFKDKGGRDVGLRFDLTVGIARYVCSKKGLPLPAKIAAVGGVWRYDEPQYGRYRWSHQWDLEIFGPPAVEADAEVIDASSAVLRRAGLSDVTVKIGDRRLVEEFIRKRLRISDQAKVIDLMRALDKVGKKTPQELRAEYGAKGFDRKEFDELLAFGELKGTPDAVISRASELRLGSSDELRELADILDSRGVKNFLYAMNIVRGIDYYTGIVFEAVDNSNPRLGSLFGGGRYDALPGLFGRPELSATGAAGGLERISMSLPQGAATPSPMVYVAFAGPRARKEALRIESALRARGVPADSSLQDRTLSRQLEDASKAGASWAVIVGEKEMASGKVTLRDMKGRNEELLPMEDVMRRLGKS